MRGDAALSEAGIEAAAEFVDLCMRLPNTKLSELAHLLTDPKRSEYEKQRYTAALAKRYTAGSPA